jgi:hypothetical protein
VIDECIGALVEAKGCRQTLAERSSAVLVVLGLHSVLPVDGYYGAQHITNLLGA